MSARRAVSAAIAGSVVTAAVLLAGCGVSGAPPPTLPVASAPLQPLETIPIRVRTSWPALVAEAEAAIPRCRTLADGDGRCAEPPDGMILALDEWYPLGRNWLGRPLGAVGNASRDAPIASSFADDRLAIALSVFYRVRVGTMDGRRQLASCGFDEPPREIVAGLSGKMVLAAEWHLDPDLSAAIDPANECTATMLNVNLSDRFAEPLREKLQAVADGIEDRIRKLTTLRPEAEALWAKASEPIDIGRNTWLEFNPVGFAAGPMALSDDGQYLTMALALEARPRVVLGERPPTVSLAPLPAPTPGSIEPDFDVNVRGLITYEEAASKLAGKIVGRRFGFLVFSVVIDAVRVSGSGEKVVIGVDVSGAFNGTLYLYGTPEFLGRIGSRAEGQLVFEDIDYTVRSQSLLARIGQALFRDRIREALAEHAAWDLSGELGSALGKVTNAINRELTPDARMVGSITSFGPGTVRVAPEGIEAWYRLGGTVEIVVDPF
jgi:hypothetical protein